MEIRHFFDSATSSLTYLVHDRSTRAAVLIDPVANYDMSAVRLTYEACESVAAFIDEQGLQLSHVLDTHIHADHVTGMDFFRERYGAKTGISAHVVEVQRTFAPMFGMDDLTPDGSQFDVLIEDGATLELGGFRIEAIPTPGHTPANLSFRIADAVFVGDLLFEPDYGTARCDFPGGSAEAEFESIRRLYELPDDTRVFTGHDYQPGGRELRYMSTIKEHRETNVHLRDEVTKEEFVALRRELETGKAIPKLLLPALQLNMRAGRLPPPDASGARFLKFPLNRF